MYPVNWTRRFSEYFTLSTKRIKVTWWNTFIKVTLVFHILQSLFLISQLQIISRWRASPVFFSSLSLLLLILHLSNLFRHFPLSLHIIAYMTQTTHYRSYQEQFITLSLLSNCLISLRWIVKHTLNIIHFYISDLHSDPYSMIHSLTFCFISFFYIMRIAQNLSGNLSQYDRTYARVLIRGRLSILLRKALTQLA